MKVFTYHEPVISGSERLLPLWKAYNVREQDERRQWRAFIRMRMEAQRGEVITNELPEP